MATHIFVFFQTPCLGSDWYSVSSIWAVSIFESLSDMMGRDAGCGAPSGVVRVDYILLQGGDSSPLARLPSAAATLSRDQ